MTDFDVYAADYEQALNRGLAASGESSEHFASGRISWLAHCLVEYNLRPRKVLDYGCGTGNATSLFLDTLGAERVVGVDLSAKSLRWLVNATETCLRNSAWPTNTNPAARSTWFSATVCFTTSLWRNDARSRSISHGVCGLAVSSHFGKTTPGVPPPATS